MSKVWSEDHMYDLWLKVEIAACQAWTEQGVISEEDMAEIRRCGSPIDSSSCDAAFWPMS